MAEKDREWIMNNAVNGVITARAVTEQGIHRSILYEMVRNGELEQCSRGIYLLSDEWEDEFFTLQQRYSRGIFSHDSALYLCGYSERVPVHFHMTFPTKYNAASLWDEKIAVTRVNASNYSLGVTEVTTPAGSTVRTYDIERSLCDVVRGQGGDIQIVLYAMKKYASSREKDVNKLMRYAKQLRVEPKIRRYMEVLL